METPPAKRQRLDVLDHSGVPQELSSPLVPSPKLNRDTFLQDEIEVEGENDEKGKEKENGERSISANGELENDDDNKKEHQQIESEERHEKDEEEGVEEEGVEEEEEEEEEEQGKEQGKEGKEKGKGKMIVDEMDITQHSTATLSPLKLNVQKDIDLNKDNLISDNNTNQDLPSFKQLIARFNNIISEVTEELNNDYLNRDDENYDKNISDDNYYSIVPFATLKNKYDSIINDLNIKLQDKLSIINDLNNEISKFKQKISNMHLTIEQSQIDNSKLISTNELLKTEIKTLNNTMHELVQQLSDEKYKRSSFLSQIDQLNESVNPIFNNYEFLHNQISDLRKENSNLQNTISQQQLKISSFDDTLKNELESLAQELYIQYAEKHESKISKLRSAYESKYAKKHQAFNDRLQLLQDQHKTLQQELAHVKNRLQVETNEKRQLVKLWDEYVALDKKDVDQMSSFVNRLK
jgi:hypothetical protein